MRVDCGGGYPLHPFGVPLPHKWGRRGTVRFLLPRAKQVGGDREAVEGARPTP
jgi:hypothetical protein